MDIISRLPLEVSQHIFSLLPASDLGRCLRVCKCWRAIANCDIFWKHHCDLFGITEEEYKPNDCSSDLCEWALIWNSFSKTLAYKWHLNSYRSIELGKNEYEGFASYGDHIAVYSKTFNNLDIYTVKKQTNRARLIVSLALCLPEEGPAVLAMDSKYIAVVKYNIVLLFKRIDNTYELSRAYAVVLNNIVQAGRDIPLFVTNHINGITAVEIDALLNNIMWLSVDLEGSFVINIERNLVRNVFTYESGYLQGNMFVTWSDDAVIIYSIEGTNEVFLDNIFDLEDVSVNTTLLSLLRGESPDFSIVEVWDLRTSGQILSKKMPLFTWTKLHPKEEILYTLEASRDKNIFRIQAWFVRTGLQQWIFERNNGCFVSRLELHFVCEKYLVFWPTASGGKTFYLFNSKTGKFIYEESRPPGVDNCVTDSLWISWPNQKTLGIRSYT